MKWLADENKKYLVADDGEILDTVETKLGWSYLLYSAHMYFDNEEEAMRVAEQLRYSF